jgi:mobilization protein
LQLFLRKPEFGIEEYQIAYAQMMANFGLERGTYGSEVKHRSNTAYNKDFKRSKQKKPSSKSE